MTIPKSITPSRLRMILMAALVLILLSGAAIFYFAYNRLSESAIETGDQVASAQQSQDTLQRLQTLQQTLESEKDTIQMTSNIMANSQNYAYQDRLINDLTVYANRAGIGITNISFMNQSGGGNEAAAGSEATGEVDAAATLPGLKKATVDITLDNPTNYRNLLNFLHYVEQNLTKLKVSKVTMTQGDDGVTVDALNLEVYVR